MLLASVVRLEGMRILDQTFTHVGHQLHRGRMASVESHKGATLVSRLTIRFLVATEERAKKICQQPGLSELLMSSLGPFPQRLVLPTFPRADYISRGEIQGTHLITEQNNERKNVAMSRYSPA